MSKLSILTVDDAAFIRDLVKRTLRNFFPDVYLDEAPNGKRAQSLLKHNQYDLILCDWEMPELSGLEVLIWLRQQESTESLEKTPFIMVTSRGDRENVVQAVEAGVTDYIGKPFTNDQLLKKVIKALSKKHKSYIAGILASNRSASNPLEKMVTQNTKTTITGGNLLAENSASEQVLTKTASKPTRIKNTNKGTAVFRTSSHESTGKIKDINLSEILLYLPREESIPALFDQVVVDIQIPEQKEDVARINGFVCSVAAPDKLETTDKIMVGVKYVDADPEKMAVLSRFIAHIR